VLRLYSMGLNFFDRKITLELGLDAYDVSGGTEQLRRGLVQPAGRTAPIWAYLMRQGASLSWST